MASIGTPLSDYNHDHPPVLNVNELHDDQRSRGQRMADKFALVVGSWRFIGVQSLLLCIWIIYNTLTRTAGNAFDPFPFILLNLVLSFQAAYTGPIVMMSQNRQAEKDRLVAQNDFSCNVTAENEIRLIMDHLLLQDAKSDAIMERLLRIEELHAKG